mmetsp:Transcript_46800/g.123251  ORF Transcript_46800/g.123251 Transcript_46800/m.123251 type:complete len:269 (-) Transcript_46800:227-1033(-)
MACLAAGAAPAQPACAHSAVAFVQASVPRRAWVHYSTSTAASAAAGASAAAFFFFCLAPLATGVAGAASSAAADLRRFFVPLDEGGGASTASSSSAPCSSADTAAAPASRGRTSTVRTRTPKAGSSRRAHAHCSSRVCICTARPSRSSASAPTFIPSPNCPIDSAACALRDVPSSSARRSIAAPRLTSSSWRNVPSYTHVPTATPLAVRASYRCRPSGCPPPPLPPPPLPVRASHWMLPPPAAACSTQPSCQFCTSSRVPSHTPHDGA